MGDVSKKVGLVAGYGNLPLQILKAAQQDGYEVVCVALEGMASEDYSRLVTNSLSVHLGEVEKTIRFFLSNQIQQVVFAGKVDKTKLIQGGEVHLDEKAAHFLKDLSQGNDDAILMGLVQIFAKAGIQVMDSTHFLKEILPSQGTLTPWSVPDEVQKDIEFGFQMAKSIGKLDIGQTVVVKQGAVMAVEAIEGTDEAISRGGKLAGKDAVVVKVAKPQQDLRFDVPTVGKDTIQSCIDSGVCALAFESKRTFLLDREEVLALAKDHNIHLVSISEESAGQDSL